MFDLNIRLTTQNHDEVTFNISILAGTHYLYDIQFTMVIISHADIDGNSTGDVSLIITAAIGFMYIAARQQRVGVSVDVGTRVDNPSRTSVQCIGVLTITATEHLLNFVRAFDPYIRLRNSGSITTSIDIADADIASLNNDIRLLSRNRCGKVGQVATAIYSSKLVCVRHIPVVPLFQQQFAAGSSRIIAGDCLIYGYGHFALRRAVQIVATEQPATLHYVGMVASVIASDKGCGRRTAGAAAQVDIDIAIDQCLHFLDTYNGRYFPVSRCLAVGGVAFLSGIDFFLRIFLTCCCCYAYASQTTAIGIAIDGSAQKVDRRRFGAG